MDEGIPQIDLENVFKMEQANIVKPDKVDYMLRRKSIYVQLCELHHVHLAKM